MAAHQYVFSVRDQSAKRQRTTINLLIILGIIIFLVRYYRDLSILNLIAAILITSMFFWNIFTVKFRIPGHFTLLIIGLALILIPLFNLMGILFLVLAFVAYRLARPTKVSIGEEGIELISLWKRQIMWQEIQHLILKDGLLSIELAGNKLLQLELAEDSRVSEPEFNAYVKSKRNI
ncbi:hypothetical protein [Pollutibacter soli]|uniref:hypothetical protein n=1 Tax=Pollutibacter soli TaxID=3034157 RepID=UPI003013F25B